MFYFIIILWTLKNIVSYTFLKLFSVAVELEHMFVFRCPRLYFFVPQCYIEW